MIWRWLIPDGAFTTDKWTLMREAIRIYGQAQVLLLEEQAALWRELADYYGELLRRRRRA